MGVRSRNPGREIIESGTAFFVSEATLLTAGHFAQRRDSTFLIRKPGTFQAAFFVEDLFIEGAGIETIECELVGGALQRGVDICILRVKGDYRASHFLKLKRREIAPGETLDVIGYPGDYATRYLRRIYGSVRVARKEINDISGLFPKCELIVSHGKADTGGPMPTYLVSTVAGMSESPVIMSGEVIGNCLYKVSTVAD